MGIAQTITDSFLGFIRDIFWQTGPPALFDGIFTATWTLEHAIQVSPIAVRGPPQIAVLGYGKKGQLEARILSQVEVDEYRQSVKDAKEYLRKFPERYQPEAAEDLEVPKLAPLKKGS